MLITYPQIDKFITIIGSNLGVIIPAITAALVAGGIAWASYAGSVDAAIDKAEKSSAALTTAKKSLDEIKPQYDANKARINELSSQNELTASEKRELDTLKTQNNLLAAQVAVREEAVRFAEKQAEVDAYNALTNERGSWWQNLRGALAFSGSNDDAFYGSQTAVARDIVATTQDLISEREKLEDGIREAYSTQAGYSFGSKEYEAEAIRIEAYQSRINDLTNKISGNKTSIISLYQALIGNDGQAKDDKYISLVERIEDLIPDLNKSRAVYNNALDTNRHDLFDWYDKLPESDKQFAFELIMDDTTAKWSLEDFKSALLETKEIVDTVANANTLDNFKSIIDSAKNAQTTLQSAYSKAFSSTGLAGEDIEQINSAFKTLEGYDSSALFAKTTSGVKLNNELFKAYSDQLDNLAKQNILEKILDKTNALNEARAKGDEATISNIEKELQMYQLLAAEYDATTSKYNKYIAATSSANARDSYTSVAGGYKSVGELIKEGWTTDDSVTSYLDLVLGTDRIQDSEKAYAQLGETISGTAHSLADYLKTNSDGKLTAQGLWDFVDDVKAVQSTIGDGLNIVSVDEAGHYSMKMTLDDVDALANRFGTTTEMIDLMVQGLADAGMKITFSPVSEQIDSIERKLSDLRKKAKESGADINKINADIKKLEGMDTTLRINSAIEGGSSIKEMLQMDDKELQETLKITGDTTDVEQKLADVRTKLMEAGEAGVDFPLSVKIDEAQMAALTSASGIVDYELGSYPTSVPNATGRVNYSIGSYPTSLPTITQNVIRNIIGPNAGTMTSPARSDGTAYNVLNYKRLSPAHAGGKVALEHNEKAITNEVGQESIVRNGEWFLLPPGPHFENLKKGDIIFNAKQTADLIKLGRTSSYARAYAAGTADDLIDKGAVKTWSCFCGATVVGTICPKCGRTQPQSDSAKATAAAVKNAISNEKNSASSIYNKDVSATSLAKPVSQLVAESASKDYLSASGSKPSSFSSGSGGGGGGGGGGSSGGDSSSEEAEPSKLDWIEIKISRIERVIDKLKNTASNAFKVLSTRLSGTKDAISEIIDEIEIQKKAEERYLKEADSIKLSNSLKEKVRDGAIDITKYDSDTQSLISEYREWYEKALDAKDAIDELHESLASLYEDSFNATKTDYENQLSFIDRELSQYQKTIDIMELKGLSANESLYDEMSNITRRNISLMTSEVASLEASLAEAIKSGEIDEYSESWYEMKNAIYDVQDQIDEANKNLIEYGNTIRDIQWDRFDYVRETVSGINSELEFLVKLLEYSDLFDENGKMNEYGQATAGLFAAQYNVYMNQADAYAEEIKRINSEIANDPSNRILLDRRNELISAQRESILAAEDEKNAIKNLISDGIEKELNSMKDLIDGYTDTIDSAKSLYDYQKKIKSSASDVAKIQKLLSAYQAGDDSEESRARIQKLTIDLQNAQDKLEEDEYSHYISDQKKLLDDLYSEYEDVLNDRLDNIDSLMNETISAVNTAAGDISATLQGISHDVGYTLSGDIENIFGNSGFGAVVSSYGNDFSEKMTAINSVLSGIEYDVSYMASLRSATVSQDVMDSLFDGTLQDVLASYKPNDFNVGSIDENYSGANSGGINQEINITIPIDHVENYDDLVNKMRDDEKFERLVQDAALGKISNRNTLSKRKYKWH